MEKKSVFAVMFAVLWILGVIAHVAAQPVEVKITTVQLKHQQMGVGIDRFSKYMQEKLKDRVRVRTYPAAQLYSGQEEIQAVIKGEIQMAFVIGSTLELLDPSSQHLVPTRSQKKLEITLRS